MPETQNPNYLSQKGGKVSIHGTSKVFSSFAGFPLWETPRVKGLTRWPEGNIGQPIYTVQIMFR